jgi:hypothetical protein
MQQFDIYFGYFEYKEKLEGKERPTIVIHASNEYEDAVYVFGVYSYKKYFNSSEKMRKLYEIKDWKHAGLDRRSFIDVSRLVGIKIEMFRTYKYLGQLSKRDIKGLIAKEREYTYLTQLDDFLKTLDRTSQ